MIKITNFVRFYTLLLLNESPKHGYSIIKDLSEKMKKRVSAGEIYPFLGSLEKIGYVFFPTRFANGFFIAL